MAQKRGDFVCLECGLDFESRPALGSHWEATNHGPSSTQRAALDRAKWNLDGKGLLDDDGNDREDDADDD